MNIDELDEKFAIEGEVGFAELEGELPFIMVSNKYAEANICLYGAHITDYRTVRSMDYLWLSPTTNFERGKAIRGGIPVCFPWFGPHESNPDLPQHGFARIMDWEVAETATLDAGETMIRLQLKSSGETMKYWPHEFVAEMRFVIGPSLEVALKVTNTSDKEIDYTCALHSYFNISALSNISIEGLQNTAYENQLDGKEYRQEEEVLTISEPLTRHYFDTEAACVINDSVFNNRFRIEKSGSTNTTVWNPGAETSKEIGDMPDKSFESFVCLETVNKRNNAIILAPGESHETVAKISAE